MSHPETFNRARYFPTQEEAWRQGRAELAMLRLGALIREPQTKILEVGCGGGALLYALQRLGMKDAQGIDTSPTVTAHATNVLGVRADKHEWLAYLRSRSTPFDLIIALDVLEHVPRTSILETLRATRERLTPAGRLIMRMPNAWSPFVLPTFAGDITHETLLTPSLLNSMLVTAGFTGQISLWETRPTTPWKRLAWTAAHVFIVRPLVQLAHYHFHGEWVTVVTPNFYCSAVAT